MGRKKGTGLIGDTFNSVVDAGKDLFQNVNKTIKTVITTNNADVLQAWTLGTSTSFANLSASAPIAKYITVVRDFVVCANTFETTQQQYRVRWSAINNDPVVLSTSATIGVFHRPKINLCTIDKDGLFDRF